MKHVHTHTYIHIRRNINMEATNMNAEVQRIFNVVANGNIDAFDEAIGIITIALEPHERVGFSNAVRLFRTKYKQDRSVDLHGIRNNSNRDHITRTGMIHDTQTYMCSPSQVAEYIKDHMRSSRNTEKNVVISKGFEHELLVINNLVINRLETYKQHLQQLQLQDEFLCYLETNKNVMLQSNTKTVDKIMNKHSNVFVWERKDTVGRYFEITSKISGRKLVILFGGRINIPSNGLNVATSTLCPYVDKLMKTICNCNSRFAIINHPDIYPGVKKTKTPVVLREIVEVL